MKIIYIIPGFKHSIKTKGYYELKKELENRDYRVVFIQISWNFRTMSQYILEAENKIGDTKEASILGFSFGAMIALKLSQNIKFVNVHLCSLSPYFSEDLGKLPKYYKIVLGINRWSDFRDNFLEKSISNKLGNRYILIYGLDETERLIYRTKKISRDLDIKNIGTVTSVGHDIGDKRYLDKILEFIK